MSPRLALARVAASLLLFSGLVWLASDFLLEGREGMGDWALGSQFWALKIHGAGSMLALVALGSFYPEGLAAWREKKKKGRNIAVLAVGAPLVLSAWLIYYGPSGEAHDWVSRFHWSFALLATALAATLYFRRPSAAKKRRR